MAVVPFKITKEAILVKLASRKFLLAVTSILYIVLTQILEIEIDAETFDSLVQIVLAFIIGEGLVDVARILKTRQ